MRIDNQQADTIINVGGDFINQGNLIAKELYLNVDGKQLPNILENNQSALTAQYSIDYIIHLEKNFEQKEIIQREVFDEVEFILNEKLELAVIGSPGVGKSCLLLELSKKYKDVIYINLKNKSIQNVILYLINKIKIKNEQELLFSNDIDACIEILQSLLVSSKMIFFIDECEAASDIFNRLLLLDKFGNKFLYTSQNEQQFIACSIETFTLTTFSIEETKKYLSGENIILELTKLNELYKVSQGNALYLFYYSQFSINPLPKDLLKYHRAIWENLNIKERECLIFIALAYLPISITTINSLVTFENLQEATDFVNKLRLVAISGEGELSIFHPSFKEFIVNELKRLSTLKIYKDRLGKIFINNKDFVQATFVLIDYKPSLLQEFGFEVLPNLVSRGDFELANRLIEILLTKKRSAFMIGYLKYHLYYNLRALNHGEEAEKVLEESLKLLKSGKDKKFYLMALMNKAIDLVEKGEKKAGLKLVDLIIEDNSCSDKLFKAQILVSLSKIYVGLHQYSKSADAAKTAYDFFGESKHLYGLISSLANLASALGCLDNRELAKKYSLKLLELPLDSINYAIKLVVLNSLTSINRQDRNFIEAKKYGHEAVYLCQHYKLESKIILNLVNYGNVIRDIGDIEGAINIYQEALALSLRLNLSREQSRISWVLSSIYRELGNQVKSLKLINDSIAFAEKINYDFGIAHGHQEKGSLLFELDDFINAGKDYEKAFHIFSSMEDMKDETRHCLTKALLCYIECNDSSLLQPLVKLSIESFENDTFIDIGGIVDYDLGIFNIHDYFYYLTERSIYSQRSRNLITSYLNYLKFCKQNPKKYSDDFLKLLLLMCKNLDSNIFIKSNLAILIEQSSSLLNEGNIKKIINSLNENINGFFARETREEFIFIVNVKDEFKFEFICYKDELFNVKLALNFILFMLSISECLKVDKEKKEEFCKIDLIKYSTLSSNVKEIPIITFEENFQAVSLGRADYSIPIYVVINDDFEKFSDLAQDINNKCNMAFIRILFSEVVKHFYHIKNQGNMKYIKKIISRIAYLYDYMDLDATENLQSNYEVDLTKLDEAIINYDHE
ncbi:hypothetical protein PF438_05035 [Elizabethkingia meningoseptica]|uniref:hypothetical protein n=1 Tax=Elizabethkingia meningoseptica TaxID=238 RepID=UPI0022F1BA3E|nr:hypothetical protein [Elizabethkingia meningoseptica]EJK5329453.1 hypothetical protein [Elizabethkingia meningoseptica]WBS75856.1 hypothetical protein PF438_05035 [Elizabethkingia meningoseptica]